MLLFTRGTNHKYKVGRTNHRREEAPVDISRFFWLAWLAPKVEYNFRTNRVRLYNLGGLHFQKRISSFDLLFLVVICLAELSGWYGTTQGWLQEIAFFYLRSGQPPVANTTCRSPLLRAWCAGPQTFVQSEKKLGKKLCRCVTDVTSVKGGWTNCYWKSGRGCWMTTACRENSSTSGRGMFGSGPHPKPCFGCLHGETSFVRGYLRPGTCMIHKLWYPWAFSHCHALNWDSRANIILIPRISSLISYRTPSRPYPE